MMVGVVLGESGGVWTLLARVVGCDVALQSDMLFALRSACAVRSNLLREL